MSLQVVVDFRVLDETEDWIVVEKPAPLIVHPANDKPEPTLLGGLESLLSYEIQNGATLGIVTRLDRETSGVVLVAKHTASARELGMMFERREAKKEYLAIVHGWPEQNDWVSEGRICRAGEFAASEIWVKQIVDERGKQCETGFAVERRFKRDGGEFSLVRCFPKTGRMHQIRVHLADAGFPIVGDKIYSGDGSEYLEWMNCGWSEDLKKRLRLNRQALHAARLEISWKDEKVVWESSIAEDMEAFLSGDSYEDARNVVIWSRND